MEDMKEANVYRSYVYQDSTEHNVPMHSRETLPGTENEEESKS